MDWIDSAMVQPPLAGAPLGPVGECPVDRVIGNHRASSARISDLSCQPAWLRGFPEGIGGLKETMGASRKLRMKQALTSETAANPPAGIKGFMQTEWNRRFHAGCCRLRRRRPQRC